MNIVFHLLNSAGSLNIFIDEVKNNFSSAIEKITAKIPVANVDVVIANNPWGTIHEIGIGGHTYNPDLVFISLDSKFPDLKKSLNENLERTLAHELHHCIRWSTVGYGKTLLESMTSEGLADHFDMEVTGKKPNLWDTVLSQEQINKYLERAKKEFNSNKYDHHAWFFGRGDTDIPRWTGYSLGFYLIGEYLKKHPDKKPSQLYSVKAEELI